MRPHELSPVVSAEWALLTPEKMLSRMGDAAATHEAPSSVGDVPVPVVESGVDLLAGSGGEVSCFMVTVERSNACWPGSTVDQPALRRADGRVVGCLAFKKESGAIRHLCYRGINAKIPYGCGNKIMSYMKKWSQIETLIAPAREVASGRTIASSAAVHIENEAVVGADADGIAGGDGG